MKRFLQLAFILANTTAMLLFSGWMMAWPYVNEDEQLMIEYGSKLKNILLGLEEKPDKEDFIFINVAYDKQLVDKLDTVGFSMGKEAITDRKLLAEFLHVLAEDTTAFRYVILDVFLGQHYDADMCRGDTLSPDSLLQASLLRIPNLVMSGHMDDDNILQRPVFNGNHAVASYNSVDNKFLKFRLTYNDTIKTVPVLMYEYLSGSKVEGSALFGKANGEFFYNSFIPKFRIRQYDLFFAPPEQRYKVDNLTNILSGAMNAQEIRDYIRNRIVVIGDFEDRDVHETIYGETGGSLILVNTYLGLASGDAFISYTFLAFLFTMYLIISATLVVDMESILKKLPVRVRLNQNVKEFLGYTVLMLATSAISILIFDQFISILYLTIYLVVLNWLIDHRKKIYRLVVRKK